jgi:hypothetical protein
VSTNAIHPSRAASAPIHALISCIIAFCAGVAVLNGTIAPATTRMAAARARS